MSPKSWPGGLLALFIMAGACGDHADPASGTASAPGPAAPAAPTAPAAQAVATPADCDGDPAKVYTGNVGCVRGELVTVAQVFDAATMTLTDSRRIRLAGVVVPAVTSCAGPAAIAATRRHVQNLQVNMHTLPGSPRDEFGNEWVYLQVDDSFGTDLGGELARDGWATEYQDSPANGEYLNNISSAEQLSRDLHSGQFGPPCGPPAPSYDSPPTDGASGAGASGAGAGAGASSDTDVHIDADHHRHHNLPDGALTGGFCRKHRWC